MKSSFIIKTLNNHIVTTPQSAFGLWGRAMMVAITPFKTVARVALNETAPLKHFLAATFFALLFVAQLANAQGIDDFVTTWSVQGSSGSPTVIPTTGSGYNYNVNWGDGGIDTTTYTGNAMHTYADAGTYTVRISGDFPRIYFNAGEGNDNSNSIIAINQWGTGQWTSMEHAFSGATNLIGDATDRPDLSRVTDMWGMFRHASKFNEDIGDWNVSNVERMGTLFEHTDEFNQDISRWDVSNVSNMEWMFASATAFNQDISRWDVRGVTNMSSIFNGASDFSQNLGAWYITGDLSVSPALEAGAEVTTFTAQNSVLSGHNPTYMLGGADSSAFTLTDGVLTINAAPAAIGALYDIRISITGSVGSGTVLVGTDNHRDLTFAVNNKPMITSNNGDSQYEITLPENTKAVTTITATDMDANTLTYTLSNNDAALFEINNAGELSFKDEYIPDYGNPRDSQGNIDQNADQEYSVLVSVSDGVSTHTQEIIVTIENVTVVAPDIPDISVSPGFQNATVGVAITPFVITNSGGTATYSISPALPVGLSIDTATGTVSGTLTELSSAIVYSITATNISGSDSVSFTLSVQPAVMAPNISVSPSSLTFTVGTPVTTNPITITNSGGPADAGFLITSNSQSLEDDTGLSYNYLTGVISGTPTRAVNARIYRIQADNSRGRSEVTITITVNAAVVAPDLPDISVSPGFQNATVGVAITPFVITNNGGTATYSIAPNLPAGLSIDTATGTVSGTLTELSSAIIVYSITATNITGSDVVTFTLSVQPSGIIAPNISVSPSSLTFTVGIPVTTNPITITNSGGPADAGFVISNTSNSQSLEDDTGLSYNYLTGVISGTPTRAVNARIYRIQADNAGGTSRTTITVTVNAAVVAPDIPDISVSPGFQNATVGVAITPFVITNNGGTATYSISPALPVGLSIDTATGTVSGTLTELSSAIVYSITATNITGSDVVTFSLSVQPGAIAPNISVSPSSLTFTVGIPVTTNPITITNSGGTPDAGFVIVLNNGQSLNTDTGLNFSRAGVISGTPTRAVSTRIYTIQADNAAGRSQTTITVTVNAAVVAPSISINPATVTVTAGTAIADIIITSSGGDAVSYSIDPDIANGLSFDETSGTISGTPSEEASLITYTITAENSVGSDTATVAITVNEAPPPPMITYRGGVANSDGTETATGYSVYVANVNPASNNIDEDFLQIAEGTSVVDTITATNDGSSSIEYFLPAPSGSDLGDNNLFEIDSSSGVLSFKSPPDYEYPLNSDGTTQGANQIYWAIVQVRNSGTDIKSELLLIKVEITNIDLDVSISARSGGTTLTGSTDTHTVELTVDQGADVTLSSVVHSYDPTEGGVTHTWTQVAGETVALDDASAATVTFRVPDQITETLTLSFLLTVSDDVGSDTIVFVHNTATITVNVPELDTPTTTVNRIVQITSKTIDVGGSSTMVVSRDIQIEVTSKGTEKITHFYASEVSTAELQTIADKAVVTDGIDFTKAPPSIDSTTTPTLVVNTAVDITVNEDACRLANGGCEVTLSYEASDEQAGKDLYVFHYDGEKWEALPHVRRGTNTVTALADSFSPFALFNASGADKLAKQMQADNKQLQADNKQLNKDILPNLVQTMLASTMSAVSTRMDATFSGTPQGSYQLDGQTVKLNGSGNLQDAMANKLPHYAKSLKNGTMDWKAMLSRSSFVLPLNAVDGEGATAGGATIWGSGEYSLVSDKGWKGDVFSLQLGVDQRMKDDLLVGGLVSWSKGDVDYTQNNKSGDYTHQITSVHPYLAWSIDDVHLWSSAGYGQGKLSKKDRNGNERRSDTHLLSLSAGVSGRLSQFGQSNLNLKSDMVLAQTNIDGSADNIPADSLASQRLRLLLEIDRELQLASGGRFHPLIEIGLRYDGGGYDAGVGNSGIGAVLGFGGRYANTGLTVEGKFHTLVGRKDYKEWGVQGTIRKTSANDQGLTFSLIPSYGATGNSANQVWKQKLSDGNKSNGDYQARLDVNVGYGLFTGGGLLTPYSELRMGKNNRYRLGLRWKPNSPFSLHLYGERKTSNDSDRILLETNIRF